MVTSCQFLGGFWGCGEESLWAMGWQGANKIGAPARGGIDFWLLLQAQVAVLVPPEKRRTWFEIEENVGNSKAAPWEWGC